MNLTGFNYATGGNFGLGQANNQSLRTCAQFQMRQRSEQANILSDCCSSSDSLNANDVDNSNNSNNSSNNNNLNHDDDEADDDEIVVDVVAGPSNSNQMRELHEPGRASNCDFPISAPMRPQASSYPPPAGYQPVHWIDLALRPYRFSCLPNLSTATEPSQTTSLAVSLDLAPQQSASSNAHAKPADVAQEPLPSTFVAPPTRLPDNNNSHINGPDRQPPSSLLASFLSHLASSSSSNSTPIESQSLIRLLMGSNNQQAEPPASNHRQDKLRAVQAFAGLGSRPAILETGGAPVGSPSGSCKHLFRHEQEQPVATNAKITDRAGPLNRGLASFGNTPPGSLCPLTSAYQQAESDAADNGCWRHPQARSSPSSREGRDLEATSGRQRVIWRAFDASAGRLDLVGEPMAGPQSVRSSPCLATATPTDFKDVSSLIMSAGGQSTGRAGS